MKKRMKHHPLKKRKVTKKAEKNEEEDVAVEVKPAKGKRGPKKT